MKVENSLNPCVSGFQTLRAVDVSDRFHQLLTGRSIVHHAHQGRPTEYDLMRCGAFCDRVTL